MNLQSWLLSLYLKGAQNTLGEWAQYHADIYWITPEIWHFHEHFENLYGYGEAIFHSDIKVTGKTCYAEDAQLKLHGTELTPYNYIFKIESTVSQSVIFNNHYFIDPNNRRIITHKLREELKDALVFRWGVLINNSPFTKDSNARLPLPVSVSDSLFVYP